MHFGIPTGSWKQKKFNCIFQCIRLFINTYFGRIPRKPLQNADLSFSMFRGFLGVFINMSWERISTKPLQNADSSCPCFSREKRENQPTTPPSAKTNATKPPVRPILPANPRTPHKILERLQHPARRPDRSPLQEQCTWPKKFCTVWVHKYYIGPNGAGQNFW